MHKRRKFTNELKEEAVKVALSSDQPLAQIASEFGIKKSTFYGWVKDHLNNKTEPSRTQMSTPGVIALALVHNQLKKQLKHTEPG